MTTPTVRTKLLLPRLRPGLVQRTRLSEQLMRRRQVSLTLVSAPAGFGKTTVLATAVASPDSAGRAAWVSLDESDREAASFWSYVLMALDRAAPGTGAGALSLLRSGQVPLETVLATVVNELSVLPEELDLVLDDYHRADGPDIRPGMTFLLDRLPPHVHLAISTRADPALPLARLRARGDLLEIRADDLRFTPGEVAGYLKDVGGLTLSPGEVAALERRTEGWVAALQLASLSLRGRDDAARFIAGFAGDDRYVVDYLVEEVLDRQTEPVRRFLLQTSVLDRMTGPLCDAVTEEPGGKATLEALERQNLFLVPLDSVRRWYRYHHLFRDVLRAHLLQERPGELIELHRRAARWYDDADEPVPAVRHALAAGDLAAAADVMELAVPALRRDRQESTLRSWMHQLPDAVLQRRPVLAIGFVGALMASNQFDGVAGRLQDIERMVADPATAVVPSGEAELRRVPGGIELYRAALSLVAGDPAGTEEHASRTLRLAPRDDRLTRSAACALSGLASWTVGDLAAAHRSYSDAAQGLQRIGHHSDVLGCTITLADIEATQGHQRQARATFERALALTEHQHPVPRGTADLHVGLGRLAWERNDLVAAEQHLRRSAELGEQADLPQNPYRWRVAMAGLRQAEGDRTAARRLLEEAERLYVSDYSPNVRPVSAIRAQLLAQEGSLAEADEWARRSGLSADDDLSYLREFEHVTLARILLARYRRDHDEGSLREVRGLLVRLLAAAENGDRVGSVIEILVLQAMTHQARGDTPTALVTLQRALSLAEPEGYARVFLDHGPPLGSLLSCLGGPRRQRAYSGRLLTFMRTPSQGAATDGQGLPDPLSDRELDVLRLLTGELDGPQIARELVVSLNTVRTHTKHIYAKLGVNSRRAAVRKAHQLGLLTRTGTR